MALRLASAPSSPSGPLAAETPYASTLLSLPAPRAPLRASFATRTRSVAEAPHVGQNCDKNSIQSAVKMFENRL